MPDVYTLPVKRQHGGSNDGGGTVEARIARLESDVAHIQRDIGEIKVDIREMRTENKSEFRDVRAEIKSDFRLAFGALIAVALGLAGLMAKGFGWL